MGVLTNWRLGEMPHGHLNGIIDGNVHQFVTKFESKIRVRGVRKKVGGMGGKWQRGNTLPKGRGGVRVMQSTFRALSGALPTNCVRNES